MELKIKKTKEERKRKKKDIVCWRYFTKSGKNTKEERSEHCIQDKWKELKVKDKIPKEKQSGVYGKNEKTVGKEY